MRISCNPENTDYHEKNGFRARAREAEQEYAAARDAGHPAEPSKDSGAHLANGDATGKRKRSDTRGAENDDATCERKRRAEELKLMRDANDTVRSW